MWNLKNFENDQGRCVWTLNKNASDSEIEEQKMIFQSYDPKTQRNSADKVYRSFSLKENPESIHLNNETTDTDSDKLKNSIQRGISFYARLQTPQGFWPGDYGGPMFLMPFCIIFYHITGTKIIEEKTALILKFIKNHQNADGGWGTHIQSPDSTMFGSVLNYVAARLLGAGKEEKWVKVALKFLRSNGGAVYAPPWAKFWLAVLGVYEWEGLNTLFPDVWLLPEFVPFHPSRWWCHCRMVYLPMAFAYAKKIRFEGDEITTSLKNEIYASDYKDVNWVKHRSSVSPLDEYYKKNKSVLKVLFSLANLYERFHSTWVREKASEFLLEYIRAEDEQTDSIDIGPVNKITNALCIWYADGKDSKTFKKHLERILDYFWLAEDGFKFQGYNGSQLWDTSFAVMAFIPFIEHSDQHKECIRKAYSYLKNTQCHSDVTNSKRFYRHRAKGGWPFSTKAHGWPISDCTSHGLNAVLQCHVYGLIKERDRISAERIFDAVNLILGFQNTDGGFPTYELQRGSALLEYLNPAATFDRIMVDYSYTELTGSAICALCTFRKMYPDYRSSDISEAIKRGISYILREQRKDGSWYGSWGVCFTYAAFFAVKSLIEAGVSNHSECIVRACAFLQSKQNADGGWGESFRSSSTKKYCSQESQVVNTSWALIALMEADYHELHIIEKGVKLLLERQQKNGDWLQEDISGVFNANCMITYTSYRNVFPVWALRLYYQKYSK